MGEGAEFAAKHADELEDAVQVTTHHSDELLAAAAWSARHGDDLTDSQRLARRLDDYASPNGEVSRLGQEAVERQHLAQRMDDWVSSSTDEISRIGREARESQSITQQTNKSAQIIEGEANDSIVLYHGTSIDHIPDFRQGGIIDDRGNPRGDLRTGFYMTSQEDEGIHWAISRAKNPNEQYVIKIEIEKAKFDTLTYEATTPFIYTHGVTGREFLAGARKTDDEIIKLRAYYDSLDYLYSDQVSSLPGFEQFVFKSKRAFEVLNESPRSVYKVSSTRELELVEYINPEK